MYNGTDNKKRGGGSIQEEQNRSFVCQIGYFATWKQLHKAIENPKYGFKYIFFNKTISRNMGGFQSIERSADQGKHTKNIIVFDGSLRLAFYIFPSLN